MYSSNIENPLDGLWPEQKNGLRTFLKYNKRHGYKRLAEIVSAQLKKTVTEQQLIDFDLENLIK